MTSEKTISENIKKLRTKLGLTQDDLVKKADIKYNNAYEGRKRHS